MGKRSWTSRSAAIATALVVPALALAACGEGDDDDDEAEQAAETTTATDATPAIAETGEEPAGALMLIMDASGSMNKRLADGTGRLDAAKEALRALVGKLPEGTEVGLRVYGNAPPQGEGCDQTDLATPLGRVDADALNEAIDGLQAKGGTPIGLCSRTRRTTYLARASGRSSSSRTARTAARRPIPATSPAISKGPGSTFGSRRSASRSAGTTRRGVSSGASPRPAAEPSTTSMTPRSWGRR